jgi:hypothetical protein
MAFGLSRLTQEDFSGGMFRSGPPQRIPSGGAYDLGNTLIDRNGGIFKRGGSEYRATAFGAGLRLIWDGWLASGQTTLVASTTAFGKLAAGAVTNLGGPGLSQAGRPAAYEGKVYMPGGFTYDGTTVGAAAVTAPYYAVVANRLLAASGSRVQFSVIGDPTKFEALDFHELPGGVEILGIEGLRASAAVFTTAGVWVIGGLARNLVDAEGNVQQSLDLYSQDLVLWGSGGIAAWEGALIVPSTEAVYLLSLGVSSEHAQSFVRISDPIVDLYQDYVRSGYAPGQAAVHQNHYLLPIIGAGDVIDVLVCRLDATNSRGQRTYPWTHLGGSAAKLAALTTRIISGFSRTPELLGALYGVDSRPVTLYYFQPTANSELDHDGTIPNWTITTRAYPTGNNVPNTVTKLKVRYQLTGPNDPTLSCGVSTESPVGAKGAATWGNVSWGQFSWATPSAQTFELLAGEAPEDHDGSAPYSWHPRKKVRYIQFRLSSHDATSQLAIRSLEVSVRLQGRT